MAGSEEQLRQFGAAQVVDDELLYHHKLLTDHAILGSLG
jgi:hypothetical protein